MGIRCSYIERQGRRRRSELNVRTSMQSSCLRRMPRRGGGRDEARLPEACDTLSRVS